MRRLEIRPEHPNPRVIRQVVEVLAGGGIVAYPTDTVYGLGCDIRDKGAVEKLYRIRDLDEKKRLSFVCADLKDIARYAWVSDWQYRVLRRYLPGPYTFVLQASREVPRHLIRNKREVGIRVPDHEVPMELVLALGSPIVSTSCGIDPETETTLNDPDRIAAVLGSRIDLILDAGPGGLEPSTVIRLIDDVLEVVRAGAGPVEGYDEPSDRRSSSNES